jgi:hypothetical protein
VWRPGSLFGNDGLWRKVIRERAEPVSYLKVYQARGERKEYSTTYGECESVSQEIQAFFGIKIADHVDRQRDLLRSCSTSSSAARNAEVGGVLTGVDK